MEEQRKEQKKQETRNRLWEQCKTLDKLNIPYVVLFEDGKDEKKSYIKAVQLTIKI